jgi:hypothetical protein
MKAFTLGAVSSLVATILTYPLQVVQTKSRVRPLKEKFIIIFKDNIFISSVVPKKIQGFAENC